MHGQDHLVFDDKYVHWRRPRQCPLSQTSRVTRRSFSHRARVSQHSREPSTPARPEQRLIIGRVNQGNYRLTILGSCAYFPNVHSIVRRVLSLAATAPRNSTSRPAYSWPGRPSSYTMLSLKATNDYPIFEKIIAGMLLLLLSPLMAAVAIAIRVDTPGPVFSKMVLGHTDGRPTLHGNSERLSSPRTKSGRALRHVLPTSVASCETLASTACRNLSTSRRQLARLRTQGDCGSTAPA